MAISAASDAPPRPTAGVVMAIALPVMLANAATPLVGLADAAVAGRLGDAAAIGGVAMGATIFNAIYWFFSFLRMGTTGFTAQALGARDEPEIAASLARAVAIATVVGIAIVVLQVPVRNGFLAFLGGSEAVQAATRAYVDWRIWAVPAGLINFALLGWLIGLERTMVALWLQLGLNILNVALAVWLALALGHGVAGVGAAAFIAETVTAIAGLVVAWQILRARRGVIQRDRLFDRGKLSAMLAVNRDLMIRTFCVLMVAQIVVKVGAAQGDTVLAANALLTSLLFLTYYLLDGYANAAETLVGQAIGARDRPRLDEAVRVTAWVAGITGLALSLIFYLSGPMLISWLTPNTDVQRLAGEMLGYASMLPLIGVWCFLLDGIFVGATRTADMRNLMLLSFAIYLAALAALLPWLGQAGLWIAHMIFFATRAVTLAWRYPVLARDADAER